MTTAETYNEITATLGEDLKRMSRKAQDKWPTLDPEILMLNWLCYRNGVDPPPHAILKRFQKTGPHLPASVKTTWAEELQARPLLPEVTPAVGRLPSATPPKGSPPGGRGSRPGSALRTVRTPPGTSQWMSSEQKGREVGTPSTRAVSSISSPEPRALRDTSPGPRSISALSTSDARLPEPWPSSGARRMSGGMPAELPPQETRLPDPPWLQPEPIWSPFTRGSTAPAPADRSLPDAPGSARPAAPGSTAPASAALSLTAAPGSTALALSSRSLAEAPGPHRVFAFDPGSDFLLPKPHPVDPSLRSLTGLYGKVDGDMSRHLGQSDNIASRNIDLADAAQKRRLDMRQPFLDRVPLFSLDVISSEEQNALARRLHIMTFGRHECLLAEGEISNRIIIIERGECNAVQGGDVVGQPSSGTFFGEASLIFDVPSKVGLVAASEVGALWLSREDVAAVVKGAGLAKLKIAARARLCADTPLLAELTPPQQVRIAERMRSERWRRGSTLSGPMHASSRLYIVEEGECRVQEKDHRDLLRSSMHSMQATQALQGGGDVLKPGQHFGMEGLLYGSELGCQLVAASDEAKTLSISYEEILACCEPDERDEVATKMHSSMQVFLLRQVPQLRSLSNESFDSIRAQVEEVLFKPWTAVVAKGSALDTIYVLKSGKLAEHEGDLLGLRDFSKLEVHRPESVTPGDCFWSEGLVDASAKAKSTLVSITHASLLKIKREAVFTVFHEIWTKMEGVLPLSSKVLSKQEQLNVVCQLHAWRFAPHRTIAVEGELGQRLFIVESGVCDLVTMVNGREKVVGQLGRGAYFGELSLFFDEPRKMTVRSVTEATVLTLSREDLAAALSPASIANVHKAALAIILEHIPLLRRLDPEMRLRVAERFQHHTWKAGETITRRHLPCKYFHFIESGTCLAAQEDAAKGSRLVHLLGETELPAFTRQDQDMMMVVGAGQWFGMRGLMEGASLGVAVWAESEVKTSCISYEELLSAAGSEPRAKPELQSHLAESLRLHFLRQLSPLEAVSDDKLLALVLPRCQELSFKEGEVIVARGSSIDAFLILEGGEVMEHPASAEESKRLWWEGLEHFSPGACFPPGSCFNEISSGQSSSNFTLLARSACRLLRVPCAALWLPPRGP